METKIVISETDNQLSHVLRARWESFLVATTAIAEALVVVAIAGQLVLTFVGMCTRFFASRPILWTEEVGFISLHVVTFIGGALAVRRRMDMSLNKQ